MRILLLLVFLFCLSGCNLESAKPSAGASPSGQQVEALKLQMNDAFAGLEMYAVDHSMVYPDKLEELVPKYMDEVPIDPVSSRPIVYEKTEEGFMLSASGDYRDAGAEVGYPKMNQDGFYVKSAEGFPKEPLPGE